MEIKRVNKVALIDADYIKHYVSNTIFNYLRTGEKQRSEISIELIHKETDNVLFNILLGVEVKHRVYLFSGKSRDTFRYGASIEKLYKGTRKNTLPKYPEAENDMRISQEHIRDNHTNIWYPDLEADDLCAMFQNENTFIYSNDKDLKQIPGTHYDIKKGDFFSISEDQAWEFLMIQCLEGDNSVDNVPGLPGHGPSSTKKVFNNVSIHGMLHTVQEAFMSKYGRREGFDMFVEQYNLLRLYFNRGKHLREKYREGFDLISVLTFE